MLLQTTRQSPPTIEDRHRNGLSEIYIYNIFDAQTKTNKNSSIGYSGKNKKKQDMAIKCIK